jgi:hypothetical protein
MRGPAALSRTGLEPHDDQFVWKRRSRDNSLTLSNCASSFGFSSLETALPSSGSSGNAIASFLLGEVDSATALFYSTELD